MKCLLCREDAAWEFADLTERIVCGKCGAVFQRLKPFDGAGDDFARAALKATNNVMFYVRVVHWTLTNLQSAWAAVRYEFQRTALDGWCDDVKFRQSLRKKDAPVETGGVPTNATGSTDRN